MYEPREDSFLMLEAVKRLNPRGGRALDMGTGSGIIAFELSKRFGEVVACDINKESVEFVRKRARELGIENLEVVRSDLFENIRGKFDLIVFNPPYLPCPEEEDPELCCGGGELIERFIKEAEKFLRPGGRILLLVSTLTPVKVRGKILTRKKLPFEELKVLLLP